MIRDGRPITPPVTSSILESITRASQLDLLEEITDKPVVPAMKWFFRPNASLVLEQRDIDRTELYAAEEAFLCGSSYEVQPILSIDRLDVGTGKMGELTGGCSSAISMSCMANPTSTPPG